MRYTKKEVNIMFSRLVKMLCKTNGFNQDPNAYYLDYASCYGGYVIEQVEGESGGIRHPFGSLRRSSAEMYLSMYMTTCALENMHYTQHLVDRKENIN